MNKTILLLLLTTLGCTAYKNSFPKPKEKISKLVFSSTSQITETGRKTIELFKDSIIAELTASHGDPISIATVKMLSPEILAGSKPNSEIHLEIKNDTFWRYELRNNTVVGNYYRYDPATGFLHYHSKKDKAITNIKADLFNLASEYEIKNFPDQKKKINGYRCHKVIVKKINNEVEENNFPFDFGATIYEMYVTDEIDLPIQTLINLGIKDFPFFPLDIKIKSEKLLDGVWEELKLVSIEKSIPKNIK